LKVWFLFVRAATAGTQREEILGRHQRIVDSISFDIPEGILQASSVVLKCMTKVVGDERCIPSLMYLHGQNSNRRKFDDRKGSGKFPLMFSEHGGQILCIIVFLAYIKWYILYYSYYIRYIVFTAFIRLYIYNMVVGINIHRHSTELTTWSRLRHQAVLLSMRGCAAGEQGQKTSSSHRGYGLKWVTPMLSSLDSLMFCDMLF